MNVFDFYYMIRHYLQCINGSNTIKDKPSYSDRLFKRLINYTVRTEEMIMIYFLAAKEAYYHRGMEDIVWITSGRKLACKIKKFQKNFAVEELLDTDQFSSPVDQWVVRASLVDLEGRKASKLATGSLTTH